MAVNAEFQEVNTQLRMKWLQLCEREQDGADVQAKKTALANEVIRSNEKLIWSAIQPYIRQRPAIEEDLFNVAAGQLWRAFTTWDPERSTLGTASKQYINGAVRREVAALDYPHLKYDDFTLRGKVVKMRRQFMSKHGREPNAAEIEDQTGVSKRKQDLLFAAPALSMDGTVPGGDSEATLASVISDQAQDEGDDTPSLNVELEPEVAANADPMGLLTHLVYTGAGVATGAQAREVGAVLGIPSKPVPRTADLISLENVQIKLRRYAGTEPTAEQLAVAANVTEQVATDFLAKQAS